MKIDLHLLQQKIKSIKVTRQQTLLILFFLGLFISAIKPHDYFTWFLEVAPALIVLFVLTVTYRRFKFSHFTYVLILLHCYVLFIGAHYTYAEVPFFDWIKETFHQTRNNYDKLGHFFQGFVPALVIRELFVRKHIIRSRSWSGFIIVSICLAFSAFYEMIEWWVSVASGSVGDAFLGTQGYVWDTQSDMLMCLLGSISGLFLLSKWQDRRMYFASNNLIR